MGRCDYEGRECDSNIANVFILEWNHVSEPEKGTWQQNRLTLSLSEARSTRKNHQEPGRSEIWSTSNPNAEPRTCHDNYYDSYDTSVASITMRSVVPG